MNNTPGKITDFVMREPVLFFAAAGLILTAAFPNQSSAWTAAEAGIIAWMQRALSTPKKSADENVESAKYVGAVEHQAVAQAALISHGLPRTQIRVDPKG